MTLIGHRLLLMSLWLINITTNRVRNRFRINIRLKLRSGMSISLLDLHATIRQLE